MDMWQRTIATKIERPVLGISAILPSFLLLIIVTFAGVLVGVFLKESTGSPFPPKYPLVDFLHSAFVAAGSNSMMLILVSIVICGFTAAMLSTVDTYLIIVSQSFVADLPSLRRGLPHERIAENAELDSRLKRNVQGFTALIPFLSVALFFILNRLAAQDTFTLYMIAGSLPLAALPIVLGALYVTQPDRRESIASRVAIFALVATFVSIVVNLLLADYALSTYSPIAFGLLYFTPLLTSTIAAIPFARLLRR